MTIMSTMQRFTENKDYNLYASVEWKNLNHEEKKAFGRAFLDKALTDSNASDIVDSLRYSEHKDSVYFA